jgi:hypothetical protein
MDMRSVLFSIAAVGVMSAVTQAAVIRWDFNGTNNGAVSGGDSAGIVAAAFNDTGSGLNNQGFQGGYWKTWSGVYQTFQQNGPGTIHQMRASFTIPAGYKFDWTGMEFNTFNGSSFPAGNLNWRAFSPTINIPGIFGYPSSFGGVDSTSGYGVSAKNFGVFGLNAPGYNNAFTNLTGTQTLVISPYVSPYNSAQFGNFFGLENVIIYGTMTAIPEPATAATVGALATLVALRRRRSV